MYPGYDQFGRTVSQMWVDGDFTEHATPSSDYGNFPPVVELTYTYDKQSNRLTAYDNRPGASQKLSHEYSYDGVDRLVLAERGDWDGTTFTRQEDSQQWTLDMLGNWSSIDTDLNGNGVYNDTNEEEDRDHDDITDANELDQRLLIGQGVPSGDLELDLTYDKAGNLRTAERPTAFAGTITWTYTHDAWNRLVLVEVGGSNDDRLINVYNGLNWRIIKQADTNADGSLDEQRMMYYSASWQLCEERIDDDATFPTDPDDADIDRHVQYVIGIRYIDDVILHREDNDVNGAYDDTWYHLTDVQFSTVAILDDAAALVERVTYDAYGDARHHYMADWDGDGDVTQAEIDQIQTVANGANHAIGQANYDPDMDIDGNGDVQTADYTIANNEGTHPALAKALITQSSVDNQIGYDSYVFNAETLLYTVRNRCYDPVLGRWLERDPMGYIDGMNLYEYVGGRPVGQLDSTGLRVDDDDDDECCECLKVTWKFKLTGLSLGSVPKWSTYRFRTRGKSKVGIRIVAQFRVKGDHTKCKYFQEEIGSITWATANGRQTRRGIKNPIILSNSDVHKRAKGEWYITHEDPLGVFYVQPMRIDLDIVVKLTCENSDGTVMKSSPQPSFTLVGGTNARRVKPKNRNPRIVLSRTTLTYNGKKMQ